MDLEAKRAMVRRIREGLKVTEVFCTRIVKTRQGSVLVGLTASLDDPCSLEESEIATLVLGEKVDQLALDRALAGSVITANERSRASHATKSNYNIIIDDRLSKLGGKPDRQKAAALAVGASGDEEELYIEALEETG